MTVVYASFWQRFRADLLDFVVLSPWIWLNWWLTGHSRQAAMYIFIPNLLMTLFMNLYLVTRYGGTPGKLLLKIRITMVDGSPVTLQAAFWRDSVRLVLLLASTAALFPALAAMSDAEYLSLDAMERSKRLLALAPPWYDALDKTQNVWFVGELISMLFNKQRRSLHDFMAGTVVVRRSPAPSREPAAT